MLKDREIAKAKAEKKQIKCVVWDLDHTVWDGIILEDDAVTLRPGIREIIETLDKRGILNSIASRNDHATAMAKLEELGMADYFLYPEINWNAKSQSVAAISESLNIALNTFVFIDDQPFEREEVNFAYPEVLCIDSADIDQLLDMPRLIPRFITPESSLRRSLYQSDQERNLAEKEYSGPNESFLAELNMTFTIKPASTEDLQRAEELTMRTNQLNTTGYTYSYDELDQLRQSDKHLLLVSSLNDRYGTYGTIGLALIEKEPTFWTVKLLLMSCRVMSRGVGTIMMSHVMNLAKAAGVTLRAHFVPNGRNRMMYITYKFGGFQEVAKEEDITILEHDLATIQPFPEYVNVHLLD